MKDHSTSVFIIVLLVIAALLGFNYFAKPFGQSGEQAEQVSVTPTPEAQLAQVMYKPEEKISQLIAYPLTIDEDLIEAIPDGLKKILPDAEEEIEEKEEIGDEETASAGADAVEQELGVESDSDGEDEDEDEDEESGCCGQTKADVVWLHVQVFNPGFVTIFGENIDQQDAALVVNHIHDLAEFKKLKPLTAVDHEGGSVQRLAGEGFTRLDSWKEMCVKGTARLEASLSASAREVAKVGVNVVFAPVVDIAAEQPVMGDRVCADAIDAKEAAELYVTAFGQYGIMPVLKHFPGMGNITSDPHTSKPEVEIGPVDTNIFNELVNKYINIGVMSSHVRLTDRFNGLPCSMSQECLASFADYYSGITLFTDALDMEAADFEIEDENEEATDAANLVDIEDADEISVLARRAEQALRAGNHVLVFGKGVRDSDLKKVRSHLVKVYNEDEEFKKIVDERFARILEFKIANQAAIE